MTGRIFVFGTLMDADVWRAVTGRPAPRPGRPARLAGWRRTQVAGRAYPMIEPARGETVAGLVMEGVTARDQARLEAYEGPEYTTRVVTVETRDGETLDATAFVIILGKARSSDRPWDLDDWRRRHKKRFFGR